MLIVRPIDTTQVLEVYSRFPIDETSNITIVITEKQTKKASMIKTPGIYSEGILSFDIAYDFKKDYTYYIEIVQSDKLLNRSLALCTDNEMDYDQVKNNYQQSTKVIGNFVVPK